MTGDFQTLIEAFPLESIIRAKSGDAYGSTKLTDDDGNSHGAECVTMSDDGDLMRQAARDIRRKHGIGARARVRFYADEHGGANGYEIVELVEDPDE